MRAKRSFRPSRRNFLAGTGAAIAALSFGPGFGRAAEEKKLNFYNWDTYIGETTLDDFRKATGISVKMDLFADNDELLAKLKNGNPGYDVIVPTNDYVERMIKAGMLMELDHGKIPNFKYLEKRFQDAKFDPGRKYSVTYMWGTIGIGYRPSKVKGTPDSWKYLYDSDEYAGRIALLAEAGTVIGCALQYLGYSFNSTSAEEINKAADLIIRQKKNIKTFAADNGQDLLASGEVDLTQEWNGDILQVMEEDKDIGFVVPKEGALLWQDCLCIPKGAPHPDNAHAFINFMNDPKIAAQNALYIQYATPNAAAKELIAKMPDGKDYLTNPAIFPPPEVMAKLEEAVYLGEERARLIQDAWTRIQAA